MEGEIIAVEEQGEPRPPEDEVMPVEEQGEPRPHQYEIIPSEEQGEPRPPVRPRFSAATARDVLNFIYNRETGSLFGRTLLSWAQLLVFYMVFYSALSALVYCCFEGLMISIDPDSPTYKLEASLIGTSPGLSYRPMTLNVESGVNFVWFKANDAESTNVWTESLHKFLEVYENSSKGSEDNVYFNCSYGNPSPVGKVCAVDVENWYPCTVKNGFGYDSGTPCVVIKLNRIFDWIPEFYNDSESLPETMPSDLVDHIKNLNDTDPIQLETVWLTCEGEKQLDRENIGPIEYIPKHGFPGYFYPYTNVKGYLSPLVVIHFMKPKRNVVISVECKAWAHNIIHNRYEDPGSLVFQLMVD